MVILSFYPRLLSHCLHPEPYRRHLRHESCHDSLLSSLFTNPVTVSTFGCDFLGSQACPIMLFLKKKKRAILSSLLIFLFAMNTTFGNCQRLVLSLGVSQHMHKNDNKLGTIGHRSCKRIMKENNTPCCTNWFTFRCPIKGSSLKRLVIII